jgi:excisionase family DNA binding protein
MAKQFLFSVAEVAKQFGTSSRTVRRWMRAGDLRYFRVGNGNPRISRTHIEAFIAENERQREQVSA